MPALPSDNLFTFLRARFPANPDKAFLIEPDRRTWSYGDAVEQSARLANLFVSLGVAPGDRIAVQVEKSAEALMVYLAALRVGAVYLPLNVAYTSNEVRYFLGDAEPAIFICRPDDEATMEGIADNAGVRHLISLGTGGEGTLMALAAGQGDAFEDVERASDDLAAILYTSGTTGPAKGAMLTHGNLRSNAETLREYWRFTAEDRLLHALPIFHTHGLFVATNVTLAAGASMIFLPRFDAGELVRHMPEATVMMGVPTFYVRLLDRPDFTPDLAAHIRLFVSGSAPLSAETHKAFRERTGHAILERYGMTETNMNSSNPYEGERIPGSVGFPLPGIALRVTDPETGRVLHRETGVIEVRGPNVFKGYWRRPEKTAEDFRPDGFFITGDLGHIDERGYVFIVGRAKDLIISGGFNVYPAEVEAVIEALDGVAECAVIGVPHRDLGEAVVAVVKPVAGATIEQTGIIAAINDDLARFKQPRRIVLVDELPRNVMGKIQKKELREAYAGLFAPQADAPDAG
ncbi:malonate--CoA ligase [Sphingomonas sp. Root710]|uniref:malonate--CoA ligase n=1 Tax=Sphingomonas sp. Root710 TaxID=1736594 RepID=UPI000A490AD4|nr:malonyl-CoA synthase [Sphingomonas sp. Root710]